MVVRFTAIQFLIFLLSHHLSSLAKQAVKMEEPFTFPTVMVNVFWMRYVAMIVAQHAQINRVTSLRGYM
jgi:hypothetical protein